MTNNFLLTDRRKTTRKLVQNNWRNFTATPFLLIKTSLTVNVELIKLYLAKIILVPYLANVLFYVQGGRTQAESINSTFFDFLNFAE